MNKLKIAFATAALVVAGSAYAQDLTAVNAKYAEAAEAVKAKNFAAAIPLFEQVISEGLDIEGAESIVAGAKQNLPVAIFQTGGAAFQGGKLDEALAAFTRAAEAAELHGNVQILNNARTWIGRTVLRQGADAFNAKDFATAAAIFQKGYDGNPNDMEVAKNLAMSYSGMKDFAKSAPIYKNIIALAESDSRFADAGAWARENWSLDALEKAGENAKAGDYQAAIDAADELLAVVPADPAINLTRLQAYNSMKNYARVTELGEAAAAAQTSDEARSDVWYLVGAAYQNMQNLPQAIAAYGKVTAGGNVAAAKTQITELQKVGK
jgi:tetratricopeptide (TPR) repeat protein